MLALKGIYDNKLEKLPDESVLERKRALFDEFFGSVNRIIDPKVERLEALDEKY